MTWRATVRHGGISLCVVRSGDHERAKRGATRGWSVGSVRRHTEWLRSVASGFQRGLGWAFTLTLSECPASADAWTRMRTAWVKRLMRAGASRVHWLTEWQRRGVPHLHGCVYFDEPATGREAILQRKAIASSWLAVAAEHGAQPQSQVIRTIEGEDGWLRYLAKHCGRGVAHYQRADSNIPAAWQGSTGRLWGYNGDWRYNEVAEERLSQRGFFVLRRLLQRWRLADARTRLLAPRAAIVAARRMLLGPSREVCETRGCSEWLHMDAAGLMIAWLMRQGLMEQTVDDDGFDWGAFEAANNDDYASQPVRWPRA